MRSIGIGVALLAWAASAAADKPGTSEPIRLGFAGASLALPEGFRPIARRDDPFTVIEATRREKDQDVVLVKLAAWLIERDTDAAALMKAHKVRMENDLSIRQWKVVRSMPLKVARRDGVAEIQTYTNRGVDILALRVTLTRPLPGEKHPRSMGYMLTVEADQAHRDEVMPTLRAILPTIKLFDPVSPALEPVEALGPAVESRTWGYSIRPPARWKVSREKEGRAVEMLQIDYLAGPRPEPVPKGILTVGPERLDAASCGARQLDGLTRKLTENKEVFAVLRKGPAKMAGLDGHEFAVRIASTGPEGQKGVGFFVQRNLCRHGLRYTLSLIYRGADEKIALAAMEKVAAGMKVFMPELAESAASVPASPATAPVPQ